MTVTTLKFFGINHEDTNDVTDIDEGFVFRLNCPVGYNQSLRFSNDEFFYDWRFAGDKKCSLIFSDRTITRTVLQYDANMDAFSFEGRVTCFDPIGDYDVANKKFVLENTGNGSGDVPYVITRNAKQLWRYENQQRNIDNTFVTEFNAQAGACNVLRLSSDGVTSGVTNPFYYDFSIVGPREGSGLVLSYTSPGAKIFGNVIMAHSPNDDLLTFHPRVEFLKQVICNTPTLPKHVSNKEYIDSITLSLSSKISDLSLKVKNFAFNSNQFETVNSSTDVINISLKPSGVSAGSYTNSNITVGTDGRITFASSGGSSGGGGGLGLPQDYTIDTYQNIILQTATPGFVWKNQIKQTLSNRVPSLFNFMCCKLLNGVETGFYINYSPYSGTSGQSFGLSMSRYAEGKYSDKNILFFRDRYWEVDSTVNPNMNLSGYLGIEADTEFYGFVSFVKSTYFRSSVYFDKEAPTSPAPTLDNHVTNKKYVDDKVNALITAINSTLKTDVKMM